MCSGTVINPRRHCSEAFSRQYFTLPTALAAGWFGWH